MNANVLQWDGGPGALRGLLPLGSPMPAARTGLWIRYTMRSPLTGAGECSLWFMAMDRDGARFARKATLPDRGARGRARSLPAHAGRRRPLRPRDGRAASRTSRGSSRGSRRCRRPSTSTRCCGAPASPRRSSCSPTPTSRSRARSRFAGRELVLDGARGGQAHLWGSKHACALDVGARQRPAHRRGRAASGRLPRRRQRLRAALRAASWDRARRSSGASAATTSARPARCT